MSDVTSNPSRPGSPSASVFGPNDLPTARPYRFVWDPASRRPGPESVTGTTEGGRGDYILGNTPYPLGVLNNPSSLNLELAALPAEWSSARLGFHAISTVLNSPHKKQAPPKPHSSLPSVPPADLPRVRRKDFDSYLKAITPEWEKYERNSQLGKEGQAQIDAARFSIPESDEEGDDDSSAPSRRPTPSSFPNGRQIPSLDTVPAVFFEQNFNLGDRATFAAVTQLSPLDPSTPTPSSTRASFQDDTAADPLSPTHSMPLLDKFSQYADTVEQHLIREISIRSTSFFAALTNLRDLQTSSTECLTRIQSLREKLKQVDEGTAKKGLELVRVKRKERHIKDTADGVKMISGVVEMVSVAKGLVGAGQWGEALEVVEELEDMWDHTQGPGSSSGQPVVNGLGINGITKLETMSEEQEDESPTANGRSTDTAAGQPTSSRHPHPEHRIPLSSLVAFADLPGHLRTLTMEIAASLSADFVAIMKDDWFSYVDSVEWKEEGDYKFPAGHDETRDQSLRDRLRPLLVNLARTKGLKEGLLSWREVALQEIKMLIGKRLPGLVLDDEDVSSTGDDGKSSADRRQALANHLRGLDQSQFVHLMKGIYHKLVHAISRLKAQGDVMLELLKSCRPELQARLKARSSPSGEKSQSQSQLLIPVIDEDIGDVVSSATELCNVQAAKLVSFRSEIHAKLEVDDFLRFFNDSWSFVLRCEDISRRMIVGLRGTIVSQAKLWLQTFHQSRITQSAKLVEDEVWNPVDVTPRLQEIANVVIEGAVKDSSELVVTAGLAENGAQKTPTAPASAGPPPPTPSKPASKVKQLRIEDRSYFMVSATSEILRLLLDYLKVIANTNLLTTDAMSRVIEFLKAFNSRTCQVVLGAGAMRSAGLKNITAKHLALASQSLSIIFELIPYIREAFRRHLSQTQAVMLVEFDKLKRDYQEHQNEIHAKLIVIMGERLDAHIKTLRVVDWNVPKEGGGANDYMLKLVKETVTLHTILSRYLAAPIVEFVMSEVLAAINHRLSEEYGRIDLPNQQAKERLLEDAKYLHQNFSPLKHVKAPTGMLETVVADKGLPRTTATPTRSNTFTNQRLRGLLSSREKPLPSTGRTPTPPAPTDSNSSVGGTHPLNGSSVVQGSLNGGSGSTVSLTQDEPNQRTNGFRQVTDVAPVPEARQDAGKAGSP